MTVKLTAEQLLGSVSLIGGCTGSSQQKQAIKQQQPASPPQNKTRRRAKIALAIDPSKTI